MYSSHQDKEIACDQSQKWHNHSVTGRKTPKKKLQWIKLEEKQKVTSSDTQTVYWACIPIEL